MKFFKNFLHEKELSKLKVFVKEINSLEAEIKSFSNSDLNEESKKLISRVKGGETLDEILPRAFALVRETAKRTLNQRPFDVQLMGGIAIHQGRVAEMMTGEGKTLAAVAPAYLNALAEKGVHIVTVNEYLARRDTVWMGQIYRALGLSVACLIPNGAYLYDPEWKVEKEAAKEIDEERDTIGSFIVQQDFLRPISRREAYLAHITYGTNHEFGFDYLRDNLAYNLESQAQVRRPEGLEPITKIPENSLSYAIIDEVDSILIDEARTPLIIAAPDAESSKFYQTFARIVSGLMTDKDYTVDEKYKSVSITEEGIEKVEKTIGIDNLYSPQNLRLVHYLEESLKAKAVFERDRDYVVRNGEVFIVDEFTGRILVGRRYSGGLHQAIEAKEGVTVKEESRTYAKISIQNYFRLYKKIAGMTGTAQTSAEEFHKVYGLEVLTIPTNKPLVRKDLSDLIYKTQEVKLNALVKEIKSRNQKGQPVLVGTTSISKNEIVSALLNKANVKHEVLNAKNNEGEGSIIAQAGRLNAVTVATNMAGRGVDVVLGGNPPKPEDAQKVKELGGLHVIGTERHEARRIDNQLQGRSGRQGDPGSSQFFLSLEDDLVRIFSGERIKSMMDKFNLPEDVPIEMKLVSAAVREAQAKVEGVNFDIRKHLLEYDDVLNKQRINVYRRRQEILGITDKDKLSQIIFDTAEKYLDQILNLPEGSPEPKPDLKKIFEDAGVTNDKVQFPADSAPKNLKDLLVKRSVEISADPLTLNRILSILDMLWMTHLENLEALQGAIGLRAYGQKEPLTEFRRESKMYFDDFWVNFSAWIFMNLFRLAAGTTVGPNVKPIPAKVNFEPMGKVGRNDPCPCGAKREDGHPKKYKHCHGRDL